MIRAAEDDYHPAPDALEHSPAEAVVWRFWRHRPGEVPAQLALQLKGDWPTGVHPALKAHAYVNHGRWVVDCPHHCGGAQLASRKDRRTFCVECANDGNGQWYEVVWPSDLEIAAIEGALDARPDITTRNWQPGETIERLVAENKAHGLPPAAVG